MGGNIGHLLNGCGVTETYGFQNTAKGIISMQGIEPWPARELLKDNLARQANLAKRHPLNKIQVEVGMKWFKDRVGVGNWMSYKRLTREVFVNQAIELLMYTNTNHSQLDRNALYDVFDSMDYDGNGELSLGEWAGGLTVYFKGDMESCIHTVFDLLDTNGDRSLSKSELMEYLKPFVNAMTPPEADALRPLLIKKCADDIFQEMDFDHNMQITSDEMLHWSKQGNNIVDRTAKIIEHEVYSLWLETKDSERRAQYSQGRYYNNAQGGDRGGQGYQNQRRPEQLPEGWESVWSAEHRKSYYCNRRTGESSWTKPQGAMPIPPPPPNSAWGGPSGHSFMTDNHHQSLFGGGY